ncbi:MAG: hypothetical protein K8S14_08950 [Actinomycetia bacterium]|nr:hypothetical protein [Actinomycetes bacterium]
MNTMIQTIITPARYHREKDQEDRLTAPVAIPKGIPIIRPNPTRNEGVIAMSGLFAREKSIMNRSSPNRRSGFHIRLTKNKGNGSKKFPVAGTITDRFTVSKTIIVKITDIA